MTDKLRALVEKWRDDARRAANGPMCDGASEYAVAGTYIACADELEAYLPPPEAWEGVNHDCQNPLGPCFHPSHATPPAAEVSTLVGVCARMLTFSNSEYVPDTMFDQLTAALRPFTEEGKS